MLSAEFKYNFKFAYIISLKVTLEFIRISTKKILNSVAPFKNHI